MAPGSSVRALRASLNEERGGSPEASSRQFNHFLFRQRLMPASIKPTRKQPDRDGPLGLGAEREAQQLRQHEQLPRREIKEQLLP